MVDNTQRKTNVSIEAIYNPKYNHSYSWLSNSSAFDKNVMLFII